MYDAERDETRPMRSKEEAKDYRYFPDPDLLPVEIGRDYVEAVRATLPELPDAKRQRFVEQYGLRADDAGILTLGRPLADYFEAAARAAAASRRQSRTGCSATVSRGLNRDGRDITMRRSHRACSPASSVALRITRSPARSPRKCSKRCGRARVTPTGSSTHGACGRSPTVPRSRRRSTRSSRRTPCRPPSTAPARTN